MIKRLDLMRWLQSNGVEVLREGGSHTVLVHRASQRVSTIPRHREINDFLARKICKDLDIPSPL
jgi:mRNA interferase HicA